MIYLKYTDKQLDMKNDHIQGNIFHENGLERIESLELQLIQSCSARNLFVFVSFKDYFLSFIWSIVL